MEGNLQLLYLLLTDCYMYLIRKGKPLRKCYRRPPASEHRPGPIGCVADSAHSFSHSPGAAEKPYMVEEAVSYNELDYISVSCGGLLGGVGRWGCAGVRGHPSGRLLPRGGIRLPLLLVRKCEPITVHAFRSRHYRFSQTGYNQLNTTTASSPSKTSGLCHCMYFAR